MESVDIVIRDGHVIDPANGIDAIMDVAIKDGKIFGVGNKLNVQAKRSFDATGCLVTPGLIDAHVHCYQYATPLGVNPDEQCLARGVTTVVDAGSAGASTYPGLKKYVVEKSKTRVFSLLHIASHGLAAAGCAGGASGGESDTLAILDEEACFKCIQQHRDNIVGVKVRLQSSVCAGGSTEEEAYRRALSVARRCQLPLMVHHATSSVPTQTSTDPSAALGCPADLQPGDIYTHTFHGHAQSIVDPKSREILSDVVDAKSRGVLFDVGHGHGSFSWTVAEICAAAGFWPDLLGSDLHTMNQTGPVYDLPNVMSKFLHLGMPLEDLVKAVTTAPAKAYGISDMTGCLTIGREADVSVMRTVDCDVMLEDSQGQVRNIKKRFIPVSVWRKGEAVAVTIPSPWPNEEMRKTLIPSWFNSLTVRDDKAPSQN